MTDLHDPGPLPDESGIWETDALLDALGSGLPVADDRMAALLGALVSDVGADPLPALPMLPGRTRLHRLAPRTAIASAAVVVVLSTGGVAAASVNAGPTSPLFPLHRVLTGQPQLDGSQRQALEVQDKLRSAGKALAAGKVARAQQDVAAAASRLPKVAMTDGQGRLAAQWTALNRRVKAQVVAPVKTGAPSTPKPTPTHHAPGHTAAPTHQPTHSVLPPTSAPVTTITGPPAAGAAPTTTVVPPTTTPTTTPAPSQTPVTSPPTSAPVASSPATQTPTSTPGKHHKPGKGGGKGGGGNGGKGGVIAPGSPPAPSVSPPPASAEPSASSAPVTVPPPSAPVTPVPSAS